MHEHDGRTVTYRRQSPRLSIASRCKNDVPIQFSLLFSFYRNTHNVEPTANA